MKIDGEREPKSHPEIYLRAIRGPTFPENGDRKLENGNWKPENGDREPENGDRCLVSGRPPGTGYRGRLLLRAWPEGPVGPVY